MQNLKSHLFLPFGKYAFLLKLKFLLLKIKKGKHFRFFIRNNIVCHTEQNSIHGEGP